MLEAVKAWPGKLGACRKVGAAANLDSSCARRRQRTAVRDEETALRSNKKTDEGQKICRSCELLDKKIPIPRELWRSSASAAMGISALAVSCRGALIASLGSGRRGGELGWPIAIGRIGVARRRLTDKAVVQGGATASLVMADREPAQ